jgi:peroxiredoxin Q/BCP
LHIHKLLHPAAQNRLDPHTRLTKACGFRDAFEKLSEKEYLIYGLSTDAPKANKSFKEKQGLQYHLLSDQKSELLKALGATKDGGKTWRSSWVIGKGGEIMDVQLGASPASSVATALKKLEIEA